MTMRPVPNEGHSNAAHWHAKWKAADAELADLRRQLAEAEERAAERSDAVEILASALASENKRAAVAEEQLEVMGNRADAAETKLALAEQDGKRLDWLTAPGAIDRMVYSGLVASEEWCAQDDVVGAWYGDTPRAAIDAALAAGEAK